MTTSPTLAQIVPDATLPVNSTVMPVGNTSIIEGGTTAGSNLFHSFREFSIPSGYEAFFNNAIEIQNIFSRVTGGNISNIDGLIRANGTANLFLLNPHGIIFGPNARLNIGGSFYGSTASSIRFADGYEFSATNPNTPPLLTINVPIGLQIGSNPGRIVNQSTGEGLQVLPGKTLALIGGNVQLDAGILFAPGGRVELGGLATPGTISLNPDSSLSFPTGVQRADVSLINSSTVGVSAGGGGSIAVTANNVEIVGKSGLLAGIGKGLGSIDAIAGNIDINATGAVVIANESFVYNSVENEAIGNGGNINIAADSLSLTNKGYLSAPTFGQGNAGSITINARSVSLDKNSAAINTVGEKASADGGSISITTNSLFVTGQSLISTGTNGEGKAGNVTITADSISFEDKSFASSYVLATGVGNGGDINITANSLSLSNEASIGVGGGGLGNAGNINITTNSLRVTNRAAVIGITLGQGNAGNINITTNSLAVTDGGILDASTVAQGNASNLNIIARDTILFDGVDSEGLPSRASSSVGSLAKGDGGNINISTNSLVVTGGAFIGADTFGQGKAGSVNINAREVSLDGVSSKGRSSYVSSAVGNDAVGDGGSVNITTNSLSVTNGAQLNASTFGQGKAGNITINARDRILIDGNNSNGIRSGVFSSVQSGGKGDGGNIDITTGSLSVTGGAQLVAATSGQGKAGNVTILARDRILFDGENSQGFPSGAGTTVEEGAVGNGGNITITTGELFVSGDAEVQAVTKGQGKAGNITITARDRISLNRGYAFTSVEEKAVGDGGNINITTGELSVTNGARLSASTFGQGKAGNINITASDRISVDGQSSNGIISGIFSSVSTGAKGDGGRINITTGSLFVTGGAQVSATTFGVGKAGDLTINARDTISFDGVGSKNNPSGAFSTVNATAVGDGGNIDITARDIFVTNGVEVQAITIGQGNAGNITITARDRISIDDSIVSTSVEEKAVGNGGNINITANELTVTKGGQIDVSTSGKGKAGNINIVARDTILFDGEDGEGFSGGALSTVESTAVGDGGNINITTGELSVTGGAFLSSTTAGQGKAGNVAINARDTILLDGIASDGLPAGVFSGVTETAKGDGGSINITGTSIFVTNGAVMSASSKGDGKAGNINLAANSILLDNKAQIRANTVGGQGNITLQTPSLILRRNSSITTNATGSAIVGGNITLEADVLAALENSDISANSDEFEGGNVTINSQAIFGTQPRAATTPESDITATGRTKAGTVTINTPDVDPSSGLIELPTNLVDITGQIVQDCPTGTRFADNEFFITGRGGIPPSPREALANNPLEVDWITPNPQAQVKSGAEENVRLATRQQDRTQVSTEIVEATGWYTNEQGQVVLIASTPPVTPYRPWQILPCH